MLKPDSLRAALTGAVVDAGGVRLLERDPDALRIWLEKGRLVSHLGPTLGWEYRYRLIALLTDFTGHPDSVAFALLRWIRVNQPDLLQNHDRAKESIAFEADILDDKTCHLEFQLELTETVNVVPREDGGFDLEHLEEPPVDPPLAGAPTGTLLEEIYGNGELLVPEPG